MGTNGKILIIDSDLAELRRLQRDIRKIGFNFISATSSLKAIDLLSSERPSIVIADLVMTEGDGLAALKEIRKFDPNVIFILLTSNGNANSAAAAMRFGAFDYIEKPVSPERLAGAIHRAVNDKYFNVQKNLLVYEKLESAIRKSLQNRGPTERNGGIKDQITAKPDLRNIVGQSKTMRDIFQKIEKISNSNANVMILGESGTGKELIARRVHVHSQRSEQALVPVDCVALPENLLESELFGYEKGAFTGAESLRRGLFEYADQGTLFLDEIGELAPNLQAKLLRVLQEGEFRRVGGKHLIRVDFRIICATNVDPAVAIRNGKLREDLYYRLNVIPIEIPPLRDRKEDIPLLMNHFLEKFSKASRGGKKVVHPGVIDALSEYAWPGNVRELQNLIEHLVALIEGPVIHVSDLPDYMNSTSTKSVARTLNSELSFMEARKQIVREFESEYLLNLLKKSDGNISKAAQLGEISRRTMYRLINTYDLHQRF